MSEQVVSDNPNVVSFTLSGNAQAVIIEIMRNKARYLAADNQNYWLTGYSEVREGVYTFQGSAIDDRLETTNLGDVLVVRLVKPDDARIRFVALAYPVMDQTGWFYRVLRIIAAVWTETKADIENHIFYWSHWSSDRQELRRQGWKTTRVFDLINDELLSGYIWWETADVQVDDSQTVIEHPWELIPDKLWYRLAVRMLHENAPIKADEIRKRIENETGTRIQEHAVRQGLRRLRKKYGLDIVPTLPGKIAKN